MPADVESVVQTWLAARFPNARAVTVLPNDLSAAPIVYRVHRVGGGRVRGLDHAAVRIDTFSSPVTAMTNAEAAASALEFEMPGATVNGRGVRRVDVNTAPTTVPYDNPDVVLATALYDVHITHA